ncbi:MAG: DNA polymerase III subunit chi [Methylococcales bacterium]|nr:DNA polymerase III subunit chi [Methylococcales bacterium]MCK5478457.1 DNA polymerase III subunit chi [Methylococcales bacterium]
MPEVYFYILSTASQQERNIFACKLIEKAYRNKQFCYVYTDTQEQSQQLDKQLWTFRPGSFIPHQIYNGNTPDYEQTVLIGTQAAPDKWQNLIFNLSSKYPDNLTQTERVLEILDNNEEIKPAGRIRYRQYQQAGLNITTYNI